MREEKSGQGEQEQWTPTNAKRGVLALCLVLGAMAVGITVGWYLWLLLGGI